MELDKFPKTIVRTVRYIKHDATDTQVVQIEKLLKSTIEKRLKNRVHSKVFDTNEYSLFKS
ncbi:hypothetical protein LIT25_24820 [Bacillus sp. F19]|nr:hypothetical protein LIT25_24820 [Bacillus sp. F19]